MLVLAAFGVVALLLAFRYFHVPLLLRRSLDWVAGLGPTGVLAFVVIYILACVFMLPGSVLTLGAGAVFGVVKGSVIVSVAATLGATAGVLNNQTNSGASTASASSAVTLSLAGDVGVAALQGGMSQHIPRRQK